MASEFVVYTLHLRHLADADAGSSRSPLRVGLTLPSGKQAEPVVTRFVRDWGTVVLLCSDGLNKHVSDERIKELASNMTSSRQLCEDLLQEALDDGGSDNITMIVGRTIKPKD